MGELDGQVFRSYAILRELGRGGMATVYLARQQSMDRLVAVKVISQVYSQDPAFRARFDQEARTIARLEHPHILPVIEYGEEDFGAFLVMRFVDGGTLEQRLEDGPLRLSAARDMLARIASALDYAHGKGVVHRDLKPANILLDEVDNPYLTDFGIAKLLQSSQQLTRTGAAVGTPAYMAPEQWKGEDVGPYTDQYSLGVVLYQMVTGDLPFKADTTYGFMHKHVYEAPDPPRLVLHDLPPAAEEVILRALEKDPAARYASVLAQSEAFAGALAGGITPPAPLDTVDTEALTLPGEPPAVDDPGGLTLDDPAVHPLAALPVAPAAPGQDSTPAVLPDPAVELPLPAAAQAGAGRGILVLAAVITVVLLVLAALLTEGFGLLEGDVSPTASPPIQVAARPSDTPGPQPTLAEDPLLVAPTLADSPTPEPTPDRPATSEALQAATLQQVARDLTATSNAALIEQATRQAAETGTAIVEASYTPTLTPTPTQSATATVTATLSPTLTPTLTPSATATLTPSATVTLTPSRTPLPTSTPAPTVTPTWTPLAVLTLRPTTVAALPTRTPRPSLTPTLAIESCPGLLASRLAPGMIAQVADDDPRPVNVRNGPGLDSTRIGSFPINTRFRVLQGPVCQSGYPWYRVERLSDGLTGWVAESGEGVYYLEPEGAAPVVGVCPGVMPSRLVMGARAEVDTPNGLPLRMHDAPGAYTPVTALIANRLRVTVEEGAVCLDGFSWWKVRTLDNRAGWVSEAEADSYFLNPLG
ncbi:MAG: protein kinase [Anaerolineae bacterium]|nr:protein kinase [Anaerolineae bacterium]